MIIAYYYCATLLALVAPSSSTTLQIQRFTNSRDNNNITLACQEVLANYVQNPVFLRDGVNKLTNFNYSNHTLVNTSAIFILTPLEEGNYTCQDPMRGITSSNNIVLLGIIIHNMSYSIHCMKAIFIVLCVVKTAAV